MRLLAMAWLVTSCQAEAASEADTRTVPADAQPICTTSFVPFAGVSLTRSFSYLAIRADRTFTDAAVPEPDATLFESGVPCLDASDRKACEERLAALHATGLLGFEGQTVYVVGLVGDDVVVYATVPDLMKLLGPIDSPAEVALLGVLQGWSIECAKSRVWRSDAGIGWNLYAHGANGDGCWAPYSIITFFASGSVFEATPIDGC